jgi:hypothetical protein
MNFVSGTHQGNATFASSYWTFDIFLFYPCSTSTSRVILTVEPDLKLKKLLTVGV